MRDDWFSKSNPRFWLTLLTGIAIGALAVGCSPRATIEAHDTETVKVPGPTVTVTRTIRTVPQSCLDMVRVGLQVQKDIDTITDAAQRMHDIGNQMYVAISTKDLAAINSADAAQHQLNNQLSEARTDLYNARPFLAKAQASCKAETK